MKNGKRIKLFMVLTVFVLSSIFSGLASAATLDTMQKDGMELVQLREAAEMYGYSVEWDGKEKSITLVYTGMMMEEDSMMMEEDNMMMEEDSMMMEEDNMMKEDMMMKREVGQTIKVWIGLGLLTVDGKPDYLDKAPAIYDSQTYVTTSFVAKYLKPSAMMN